MYEGIAHLLGERVLAAAAAGVAPPRLGNRSALCVPQGVYPCAGDDEWLALSVCDDEQWRGLCAAVGDPQLDILREAGLDERRQQHDRIDGLIAAWTRSRGKHEAAACLQAHGVPAGPVQKASDLPFDPQLQFRGAFQPVVHDEPALGYRAHPHLTLAWRTEGFERPALEDAHPEGADNRAVLRAWLGLPAHEVRRLERDGALLPARHVPVPQGMRRFDSPVDGDFAARLGLAPAGEAAEAQP
jgi:crotonobetainyl-CoA:carnitine CoA-transferase CaiB-like acyl-CoA transferase